MPVGAGLLIVSAAVMFGVSIVLLLRSPFRMPIGERVFRRVWLGPFGRAFYWVSARGGTNESNVQGDRPTSARIPLAVPKRGSLEARVAELERWRKAQSG